MCLIPYEKIKLYRMVHIENIPHILQYGITSVSSSNSNTNYVPIGDASLIRNRKNTILNIGSKEIAVGNFIPFYFWLKMPMLYVVQHGYNYTSRTEAEKIVYVVVSLSDLVERGVDFYFTDGHAKDKLSKVFDRSNVMNIENILDWKSIRTEQWAGDGIDTEVKRKKQAEFLYPCDIPVENIVGYGCYNENAKQTLVSYGVKEGLIKVLPQYYYKND